MNQKDVHIIGADPVGLVAAINLARTGLEPIVIEQRECVVYGPIFLSRLILVP